MDKVLSVHEKKATKQAKTKKKPVKVVYISNPMKVKTTASEFRALVQELTGREASMPDSDKHPQFHDSGDNCRQMFPDGIKENTDDGPAVGIQRIEPASEAPKRPDLTLEPYDDVFMPQLLDNLTGFFPSNLFYESHQVDVLRSL
ncbi:hypothetical protein U1Q18_007784 [Sarracenia purpurea var. burkii]